MTQRVQTWGHILPGHTQGVRKTVSQTETEGGHVNTHARGGYTHHYTTCTNLGTHFTRTHREVCERQTRRAEDKDRQKRKEDTLTLTRAGVYIMTQRVQTCGHIFRGHIKTIHTNKYKFC